MSADQAVISGDDFRRGFHIQSTWGLSMASAFFFGEIGAGLFLASVWLDDVRAMTLGIALTALGKTSGHLLHLGQPLRAWRAIANIRHSWVSRGLLAIILFTGCGIVHVLDVAGLSFGLLPQGLAPAVTAIAVTAAAVVMVYQGFCMSHSSSIALWSSGLMPAISFAYAALAGVSMASVVGYHEVLALHPQWRATLAAFQLGLLGYAALLLYSLMHAAHFSSKGGRLSVQLLTAGALGRWFWGAVVGAGLLLPALMLTLGAQGYRTAAWAAVAVLAGYFTFRVLVLRAAVYDPIQGFAPRLKRL